MSTTAIIAVLGTLAGATITGLLNIYITNMQQEQMNNRVEAEKYVEAKLDTFVELDEALVDIDEYLVTFVFRARKRDYDLEMSEEKYKKLEYIMDESNRIESKSGLFLDWETRKQLAYSFAPLRVVFQSISYGDDRKIDWEQVESTLSDSDGDIRWELGPFRKHIRDARIVIKEEINAPIRQLR